MIEYIKNNTLIICPSNFKSRILKQLSNEKKLLNISFLSIEEYKKNYYFDYDYKAIKYLCDKYKYSVDNSKEIIDNLYYVKDVDYHNQKLNDLVSYKKELNDLLIYNPLFKEYLKNKKVVVTGYGKLNKFNKAMFNNATIIEYLGEDKKYQIKEFNNIDKEVEYIYNAIFDLLKRGVDINKIHLLNLNEEYNSYLKRYNSYYPFKIYYKSKDSLYGLDISKEFLNRLDNREELYNYLIDSNNKYANRLINIINKYVDVDLVNVKDLIINDLKNSYIDEEYRNVVSCDNMFTPYDKEDYVFLLGFNDTLPSMKKDNDYITNNIRELVDLPLIEQENVLIKENTLNYLSSIDNLFLSYSKMTPFSKHEKQVLFNDVEYINVINDNNHSDSLNRYKYSLMLDELNKYGSLNEDINAMYSSYGDNDYDTYDNSFKSYDVGIKEVSLSYTSLQSYNKCAFSYYLDRVLKIDDNDGNFNTYFGNVAHYVLEKKLNNDSLDFDTLWQEGINKYNVSFDKRKDEFFFNKLKEEIREDIDVIKGQKAYCELNKQEYEKDVLVKVNKNTSFKGKIDKILKKDDYVCVIDYKTGNNEIEEDLFQYGLSLQLPSYLYLLKNTEEYKNSKVVGYYLQHLLLNGKDKKCTDDSTLDDKRKKALRLDGYSSNDRGRVYYIDNAIDTGYKSEVIKSMLITKKDDDFGAHSKVVSDADINDTIKLVKDKIVEASDNILNNRFDINPKIYGNDNISCVYCKMSDICFRRVKDNIYLKKKDRD